MTTSVLIPYRNDPYLWHTVDSLLKGVDSTEVDVIIIDDASDFPLELDSSRYPNVSVVRTEVQRGVAVAFETGVKLAKGEILILMGSDIITKDSSWVNVAKEYTSAHPNGIACSTCLSGSPKHLTFDNLENDVRRYGARLLPLAVTDTLPSDSPLTEFTSQYTVEMLVSRWHKKRPEENINEVACLLGAFYITTKQWFKSIHGWDGMHRYWGNLEPWISLKSWLYGGYVHNIRDLETIHIFHKFETAPNGRNDWRWYNAFFIAHTMLPERLAKELIDKVYSLRIEKELYTLPFNLGRKLIKEYWGKVVEVRERNNKNFTRDWDWIVNKFKIEI